MCQRFPAEAARIYQKKDFGHLEIYKKEGVCAALTRTSAKYAYQLVR